MPWGPRNLGVFVREMDTWPRRQWRPVARRGTQMQFRSALAVLALALSAPAAGAPPPLPGIGQEDRRVEVDAAAAPWHSLAKVQSNIGTRCTGALVGPRRILTAAHCLFNPRTQRFLPASSLHVLFGYERGDFMIDARVADVIRSDAYNPLHPREDFAADWAILVLDQDAPGTVPPLAIAPDVPPPGTAVALGGYSQDKAQIITADTNCTVLGTNRVANGAVLIHNCTGTRGTSGAPLLALKDGNWQVVGVAVAGTTDRMPFNYAVPTTAFGPALH